MSNKNETLNYEKAYEELQQILKKIDSDEVSIDELSALLERAKVLITFCQNKLKKTEAEIEDIFQDDADKE